MFLQARNSSPSHVVQFVVKTFPPASSHFPSRRAARLGGAPFKSCPGLSKLSHPSAIQEFLSAKRFSCFSILASLPLFQSF